MSDSETSSEVNINMYDNKGKINSTKSETKKSSDTDYYMNLLANGNKTLPEKKESISESDVRESESSSSRRSTSSVGTSSKKSNTSRKSEKHFSSIPPPMMNTPMMNAPMMNNSPKQTTSSKPSSYLKPMPSATLSPQEIRMKKIELLRKLSEIKTKGFSLTKDYDFNSSIDEMEYEYELLKSFVDKRNGIKIYKNLLLNGVSVVEFLNDKYDPFDFHLQGWGEHMSVEVDSYDDVLEELYEKYKGTGKNMPPEIKLLLLIVASASAFHFTKTQSSLPGLDSILNKNPDLVSRLINPQKPQSQFMSEQELNIQKQRALIQEKERQLKQNQQRQAQQTQQQMQQQQQQQQQQSFMNTPNMPGPRKTVFEPAASNQSGNKIPSIGIPEIRAPSNVQDILSRIKLAQAAAGQTDTQEESSTNNDRILSDANLSDSRRGRKARAPPAISINT
jgi:hypothetical protein